MPQINGVEILTPQEAADFLKIKITKLYQLVATCRDFPAHKAGDGTNASLRFIKQELANWLINR